MFVFIINFKQLNTRAIKLNNKKSLLILLLPLYVINLDPSPEPIATPMFAMTVASVLR